LIFNCHSKKKLRVQAQVDAEAAIATQTNRSYCKNLIKGDPPPDYELPPTYIEAVAKLKYAESFSDSKLKSESELRLNEGAIKSNFIEERPESKLKEGDLPPEISNDSSINPNLKVSESDVSSSLSKSIPPSNSDVQCHI
jgi:hypothetical protein